MKLKRFATLLGGTAVRNVEIVAEHSIVCDIVHVQMDNNEKLDGLTERVQKWNRGADINRKKKLENSIECQKNSKLSPKSRKI